MSLQGDWQEYVGNPDAYPYDHFAPLIADTEDPLDLNAAFGKTPNGGELISRINRVRDETEFTGLYHIPSRKKRIDRQSMSSLSERYADSIANRLREIGKIKDADAVFYKPTSFIKASEFRLKESNRELPFINASMHISRDFNRWKQNRPPYFRGLREAVLFMTKYPPVTRYILSAIVDYPVDDEAYFELWAGGGDIEFCEDRTLIILPDDYEEPKVA